MGRRHTTAILAVLLAVSAAFEPSTTVPVGWTWPLTGPSAIVHAFDPPAEPWQAGHRGVDLAGIEGEPVYAAGSGVVTYAGLVAGIGVVTVTHGDLRTTYQPVTATVRGGEQVAVGQQIGTLDGAGNHCAPSTCLHWGLRRGDVYLDPMSLIPPAAPPRLLPLGERAMDPAGSTGDRGVGDGTADVDEVPVMPAGVSRHAAIGALAGIRGG
jgi:murein DD-endopeptidase MepM/ murein hydrolase activator NlpD